MTRVSTSHPSITVVSAGRATELLIDPVARKGIGGALSISDPPPDTKRPPAWVLRGFQLDSAVLMLNFRDVWSEEDSSIAFQRGPMGAHVHQILMFGRACAADPSLLLVHCKAGRSRSTAAAFIILCDRLGVGREDEAMDELLRACERTPLPNPLMCKLADDILCRGGRLLAVAAAQNEDPRDAEADALKPVTGTALLAAVRDGRIRLDD